MKQTNRLIMTQSVPDISFLGMNVCRPDRQRQCQCQFKNYSEHSDAFLCHSNKAGHIQESAFGQCVYHAARLPFKKLADSNRLILPGSAIHI